MFFIAPKLQNIEQERVGCMDEIPTAGVARELRIDLFRQIIEPEERSLHIQAGEFDGRQL